MQLGIGVGTGFGGLADAGAAPYVAPAYDQVVLIGASLIERPFGQSLSTPSARASDTFRNAGLNVNVHGYGFSGEEISGTTGHIAAAFSAFPSRTLFVIDTGGNNVNNTRPYAALTPSQISTIKSDYDALITALQPRAADVVLCNVSFRTYETTADVAATATPRDWVFSHEDLGSKPYNDAFFVPKIAAAFPATMNSDGQPVADLYNATRNLYDAFIDPADGLHPADPQGLQEYCGIFCERLACFINGGTRPAPYARATLAGAGSAPQPWSSITVSLANLASDAKSQTPAAFGFIGTWVNTGPKPLYDALGKTTGVSLDVTTAAPPGGSGYGVSTNSGLAPAVARYNGHTDCGPVMNQVLWLGAAYPMSFALSGLAPGGSYRIAAAGTRAGTTSRLSRLQDANGVSVQWNSQASPVAAEQSMTCTASGSGSIVLTLSCSSGTFAYLSGLRIEPA